MWKKENQTYQRYTSMGLTQKEHISEGMCRRCAWENIKHECKVCGQIIGKGYPRLLAHIAVHYISGDSFIFKREDTMSSKWIDHIKSHYIDKDLVKKEWIAKDIFHLNYDSVLQLTKSHNNGNNASSTAYCDLTERERNAYRNALHRIKSEESITKNKGR